MNNTSLLSLLIEENAIIAKYELMKNCATELQLREIDAEFANVRERIKEYINEL